MNDKTTERRLHKRRGYRTKVVFEDEFGDGLFYIYSSDISLGGLFLESDIPVRIGTMLLLSFQIPPHKRPIHVTGEVVRRALDNGMGIRFLGLNDLALERLEEFLKEKCH